MIIYLKDYCSFSYFRLSELKIVGYKRDKTFVDEQQLRRLQQMSIMQQHIQEAAKLPPEAAAKLVDASYTLCEYSFFCFLIIKLKS